MEQIDEIESVELICVRCGHANDDRASRCSKCNSPLDAFASSSPWEMGTATSSAYSAVSNPKTKSIIFWGTWLYFGPSAIGAIWYVVGFVVVLVTVERPEHGRGGELAGAGILGLVLALLYGALSIWALWSVSKGYFRKQE